MSKKFLDIDEFGYSPKVSSEVISSIYELIKSKTNWEVKLVTGHINGIKDEYGLQFVYYNEIHCTNYDTKASFTVAFNERKPSKSNELVSNTQLLQADLSIMNCKDNPFLEFVKTLNLKRVGFTNCQSHIIYNLGTFLVADSLVPSYVSELVLELIKRYHAKRLEDRNNFMNSLKIPKDFKIDLLTLDK